MALPNKKIASIVDALDQQMAHSVWQANQLGHAPSRTVSTGFAALDAELPDGGWPHSTLTELLLQKHGIGEMRLLRPALAALARTRRVALLAPPFTPHIATWSGWDIDAEQLLLLNATRTSDALWAAEQVLLNGSCGAAILWQKDVKPEALRRLQLAAQASDTVFWLVRPATAQHNPSPSPLRLLLQAASAGVEVHVVKRRGPLHEGTVFVQLLEGEIGDLDPRRAAAHASGELPSAERSPHRPALRAV